MMFYAVAREIGSLVSNMPIKCFPFRKKELPQTLLVLKKFL